MPHYIDEHLFPLSLDASDSQGLITKIEWVHVEGPYGHESPYIAVTTSPNKTAQTIKASFTISVSADEDSPLSIIDTPDNYGEYSYTIFLLPAKSSDLAASTQAGPNITTNNSVTVNDVTAAVSQAKQNGKSCAELSVTNADDLSAIDLCTLITTAKNANMSLRITADTTANGVFCGRLVLSPSNVAAVTNSIAFRVTTEADAISSTLGLINKYYDNTIAILHLDQNGDFGFPVRVVAKPDLSSLNTSNLMLYSYDCTSRKYYAISDASPTIDADGFLSFTTSMGGDIIITDKALVPEQSQ